MNLSRSARVFVSSPAVPNYQCIFLFKDLRACVLSGLLPDTPPEVLLEQRQQPQYAEDVWSAGVLHYICLCGFPPFAEELKSAEYPYDLNEQISRGLFGFPSPYFDEVPVGMLELVNDMAQHDTKSRPSAVKCLETLKQYMEEGDDPTTSQLDAFTDTSPRLAPRRRIRVDEKGIGYRGAVRVSYI
jgi:serine/threonine protein kinase